MSASRRVRSGGVVPHLGKAAAATAFAALAHGLLPLSLLVAAPAASAQVIAVKCDGPYDLKDGACVLNEVKLKDLKDEPACSAAAGTRWDKTECKAADKPPSPNCGDAVADLVVKDGKCVLDRKVPRTTQGQYQGDCFEVKATPDPNPYSLVGGRRYDVQSQRTDGSDKLLVVVEAKSTLFGFSCRPIVGTAREIPASEFNRVGSRRLGWTTGVLTLPFKYYPGTKSLTPAGAIGPYVGRRSGTPGSAVTFAGTAAVGAVQGEATDASGNATKPTLFAVSLAAGWMFDIGKEPGAKPFKIGMFVGKDFVSSDNAAKYAQDRRTWLAFQIGFDFTDN